LLGAVAVWNTGTATVPGTTIGVDAPIGVGFDDGNPIDDNAVEFVLIVEATGTVAPTGGMLIADGLGELATLVALGERRFPGSVKPPIGAGDALLVLAVVGEEPVDPLAKRLGVSEFNGGISKFAGGVVEDVGAGCALAIEVVVGFAPS
jgi:hypothetical protein